ncbi:hypothetical protein M0802_016655 [Mischocyttarus mexicanus]|nr:hypothetical protein M0802_016655 [Mischocyttarus mexicanus]
MGIVKRQGPYEWIHASIALFGIINARRSRSRGCFRGVQQCSSSFLEAKTVLTLIVAITLTPVDERLTPPQKESL